MEYAAIFGQRETKIDMQIGKETRRKSTVDNHLNRRHAGDVEIRIYQFSTS